MKTNKNQNKEVLEGEPVVSKNKFEKEKENSDNDEKIKSIVIVIQTVIIISLVVALKVNIDTYKLTEYERTTDYNRIEEIIERHTSEQAKAADVDYERIEQLMKENQANVEKDFGEKFEEMTSYFGEKFKGFVDEVNKRLQDNK